MNTLNVLWQHSLPLIKYLFFMNSYVCPIRIFIFDTEQEHINSADGFLLFTDVLIPLIFSTVEYFILKDIPGECRSKTGRLYSYAQVAG
jgi:hypothetical protein